ncbi:hypothetical protein CENSYa_1462 [Cenarchaeum symbiosum A]|uniref:Uncharacterized protein n=1 Tax=Cenarchaeum symbiosum (strain A) TaxID=414004 RepID=A0RXL7_CENSY|nr:hypothetical protein CENSYa_1462 [Cenarchaeum symbiosum A]
MSGHNYAGSIIVNLASLPDFLRKPILTKRMKEFFAMGPAEREEVIGNALEAGPTIPFPNFAKLLKTWLEILASFPEDQRALLFSGYVDQVRESPQKLIPFNLDGMLEVYLSLAENERGTISATAGRILGGLDDESRRRVLLVIPARARDLFGL